jgi:hypothetical protein
VITSPHTLPTSQLFSLGTRISLSHVPQASFNLSLLLLKSSAFLFLPSNIFFVELVRFQPEEALTWLPYLPTSSPLAPFNDTRDKLRFFPMPLSPHRLGSRRGAFTASRELSPIDDHRPPRRALLPETQRSSSSFCRAENSFLYDNVNLFVVVPLRKLIEISCIES